MLNQTNYDTYKPVRGFTGFLLKVALFTIIICCSVWIFRIGYYFGNEECNNADFQTKPEKPNFVIFLADDLGYGDLSSYGHPTIRTPNIDELAYNGMKLSTFYSQPMCSPTRAALLTGRIPIRTGTYNSEDVLENNVIPVFYPRSYGMLPISEILLPEILATQGYTSGIFGKWHLGSFNSSAFPLQRGFDKFWGVPYSTDMGCPPGIGEPCLDTAGPAQNWVPVPLYRDNDIIEQPTSFSDFMPRMTSEALSFIDDAHHAKKPFLLYVPFVTPHVPLFTAPEFEGVSARGLYGDVVEEIDASVGLIIQRLKDLKLEKETLVIFTSDNGPSTTFRQLQGTAGLFRGSKGTTWEGGVRVPSIFHWPGMIAKNRVNYSICAMEDIFTTLISLAGGSIPSDRVIDGIDLSSVLFENQIVNASERVCVPYYTQRQLSAVRCGAYKLHYYVKTSLISPLEPADPPLLFNVNVDPSELYPLNISLHSDVIEEIDDWLNEVFYPSLEVGPGQFQFYNSSVDAYQPCCSLESQCYCVNQEEDISLGGSAKPSVSLNFSNYFFELEDVVSTLNITWYSIFPPEI